MSDLRRARAQQFGLRLRSNIPEALRCGGDRIAVDAVLAIVEQDDYPTNDRGQILLPSYDFFQQCAQVFEDEKRAAPYFNHKQLSYSFEQAQTMVRTADGLRFPVLAGSSLPVTWRLPDVDIPLGAQVEEAVMVGVGAPGGMDFDALEALQCMLERRKGGETGVKAVQLLEGVDVWAAGNAGRWSNDLLSSALSRSGRAGNRLNPILSAAACQRDELCMPGAENRADISQWKRGLSGGAYAADDRSAGGVSAFKTQAEPALGNTTVGY